MHVNWLMPLGGALSGTLPNPELSSASVLHAQIFGKRQIAVIALDDAQAIEANQVFGRHQLSWVPASVDDAQAVQAGQIFGFHFVHRNHNEQTGLQGGTTNEYYHLTAAQVAGIVPSSDLMAFAAAHG